MWPWRCVGYCDVVIPPCLVSIVFLNCIDQSDSLNDNMDMGTMWYCALVSCTHHSLQDRFWGVRCSGVECRHVFLLPIPLIEGYFIMMFAIIFETIMFFSHLDIGTSLDVSPSWTFSLNTRLNVLHLRNPLWHVISSIKIFYKGVTGFLTDYPCGVWYCRLTTCFLCVVPLFGNLV